MGIEITSYDIVAVHRIGRKNTKKPRNVIVRFVNRKNVYRISKCNKLSAVAKTFGFNNVYTYENLCPEYRYIFNKCYKLKKQRVLKDVWSVNGRVNILFPDDEYPTVIEHCDDIDTLLKKYLADNFNDPPSTVR